jgi:4-hydroxymandelate oxidase
LTARELLTCDDWESAACATLSPMAWDYYRSGADEEHTLRRNREAWSHWEIWYRVLVDVAQRDLRTKVLGTEVPFPILAAPTAYHRLAHPDGELASAAGVADAGTILCVSTLATTPLEDVARASAGPKWFQLYVHKDRGLTRALLERAREAGYRAIVLTVDTPVLGRRLADVRNQFALPEGMQMANLVGSLPPDTSGSQLASYVASRHDAALTDRDLEWIRGYGMPLAVKGVVRADDARRIADAGADAIIVSNHGARQLDGAPATLDALPGVVDALAGRRCEVLVDGGVRWGRDVLIALALGARAVMIGRPVLWGLSVAGRDGVRRVIESLRDELSLAMALAGCPNIASITRDLVRRPGQ